MRTVPSDVTLFSQRIGGVLMDIFEMENVWFLFSEHEGVRAANAAPNPYPRAGKLYVSVTDTTQHRFLSMTSVVKEMSTNLWKSPLSVMELGRRCRRLPFLVNLLVALDLRQSLLKYSSSTATETSDCNVVGELFKKVQFILGVVLMRTRTIPQAMPLSTLSCLERLRKVDTRLL